MTTADQGSLADVKVTAVQAPAAIAILVRHGDYQQLAGAPSAWQPFGLTGDGVAQARHAAKLISDMLNDSGWQLHPVIHCSNLLRAWQTARLIADELQCGMQLAGFDALAERGVGSAANLTVEQIEQVLNEDPRYEVPPPGWKSDRHYRLPFAGAESLYEAGQRVAAHLEKSLATLATTPGVIKAMLFVGHGAAMRHAACQLGALSPQQVPQLSMYHAMPIALQRQSACPWRHVGGQWKQRRGQEAMD